MRKVAACHGVLSEERVPSQPKSRVRGGSEKGGKQAKGIPSVALVLSFFFCTTAFRALLSTMNFPGNLPANADRTVMRDGAPATANEAQRIELEDSHAQELENLQRDGFHAAEMPRSTNHIQDNTGSSPKRGDSTDASSSSATDVEPSRGTTVDHADANGNPSMYLANEKQDRESAIPFPASSSGGSEAAADSAVHKLARQASRMSKTSARTLSDDPFLNASNDPRLDPTSPKFSARAYTQAVLKVHAKDRNAVPMRRAGIAFRNLTASGIGADTEYQKTIFNAPLALGSMVRGLLGKKGNEIKILDGFAGLVRAGEMLVVLGPPGSGCSTFLKTIAGETHGFSVSDDSYINYQGIGPKQMHSHFRGEIVYAAEVEVRKAPCIQ